MSVSQPAISRFNTNTTTKVTFASIHLPSGGYQLTYFDEFIDQLLTEERVCEVILPRLTRRDILEETEGLAKRTSLLVSLVLLTRWGSRGLMKSAFVRPVHAS
jgi:hypothetical protein